MPSVTHAVSDFLTSIASIFVQLFNSVFAVFHAIFALGIDIVNSVVGVVRSLVGMVLGLFEGVLGFVAANFLAIIVIAGGYFAYTQYQAKNGGRRSVKA